MKPALTLLLLLSAFSLTAQNLVQNQKLISGDRQENDEFGNAVAISGDYAIVGAKREDHDGNGMDEALDAGSAYILKRNSGTWHQEAKLIAADRQSQDHFGESVDISGTYAIVGAPNESSPANAGAAYIYERGTDGTWVQVTKLMAPIRKANDYFGYAVAIDEDFAVVGAYYEDEDENETNEALSAGSAYIFKRNNATNYWEFYQKIVADDRHSDDRFGLAVGISGATVVVGAEFDDILSGYTNGGSAYVFEDSAGTFIQTAHLHPEFPQQSFHFGNAVDVDGDFAIIGSYQDDYDENGMIAEVDAGSAYVFQNGGGGWAQVGRLLASDRADIDFFGYSVAISGNKALVGAYRQNFADSLSPMFSDAGAAYIYDRNEATGEWTESQKITATVRATEDQFGFGVALDGSNIIIGAPKEDENEMDTIPLPEAGAVYIFGEPTNSIEEYFKAEFQLYPNPTSGIVNIRSLDSKLNTVQVFNSNGQMVLQEDGVVRIDLSQLDPGLYLVRLTGENQKVNTYRVIKQN